MNGGLRNMPKRTEIEAILLNDRGYRKQDCNCKHCESIRKASDANGDFWIECTWNESCKMQVDADCVCKYFARRLK